MKRRIAALAIAAVSIFTLAGCGGSSGGGASGGGAPAPAEEKAVTLKIGASPAPHEEILQVVKEILAGQGITLEIVEFTDYIQPNEAVESGDIDANYFQHITYMNNFNAEQGTHLASVAEIHYEPMGIYAGR